MTAILMQVCLLSLLPSCVGFITVPWTNKLAKGNGYIQNFYLAVLRFIWTIFVIKFHIDNVVLAFLKSFFLWLKNLI